jgi:DNA-binding transcriptional LysR family regulator
MNQRTTRSLAALLRQVEHIATEVNGYAAEQAELDRRACEAVGDDPADCFEYRGPTDRIVLVCPCGRPVEVSLGTLDELERHRLPMLCPTCNTQDRDANAAEAAALVLARKQRRDRAPVTGDSLLVVGCSSCGDHVAVTLDQAIKANSCGTAQEPHRCHACEQNCPTPHLAGTS